MTWIKSKNSLPHVLEERIEWSFLTVGHQQVMAYQPKQLSEKDDNLIMIVSDITKKLLLELSYI